MSRKLTAHPNRQSSSFQSRQSTPPSTVTWGKNAQTLPPAQQLPLLPVFPTCFGRVCREIPSTRYCDWQEPLQYWLFPKCNLLHFSNQNKHYWLGGGCDFPLLFASIEATCVTQIKQTHEEKNILTLYRLERYLLQNSCPPRTYHERKISGGRAITEVTNLR